MYIIGLWYIQKNKINLVWNKSLMIEYNHLYSLINKMLTDLKDPQKNICRNLKKNCDYF